MDLPSLSGEVVEFENSVQAIVLNLEEDNVGVVLLGPGDGNQRRLYGSKTG